MIVAIGTIHSPPHCSCQVLIINEKGINGVLNSRVYSNFFVMVAIDYSQINANHDLHKKMTKSLTIHCAQIWSNFEFVIRNKNSRKNSDWLHISFCARSVLIDYFPQFLFSLLMFVVVIMCLWEGLFHSHVMRH